MAAGLGFKTFTTGEVLTAADVNGYLMQGILVFANAAARTSAITSPQEGQYSFLKDTNALEYYDGAAWVGAPVGDITQVSAGVGLSGGGSSGAVTLTNDMATTITAAGDIVVGTGSGTYDNLPIGSTGQVLTADTTVSPYKVKWATAAGGGGKVLQVVSATSTTDTSITSTTFTDANLTATITPTLATSKILVLITVTVFASRNSTSNTNDAQIMRNSTVATDFGNKSFFQAIGAAGATVVEKHDTKAFHFLDAPASTSALVYKLQGRVSTTANSNTLRFQPDASTSSILLLEIGA